VWNGSGHDDWGLLAADRLLRNGFQVAEMREIDELHEETAILDFTSSSKGSPIPLLTDLFDADSTHVSLEAGSEASAPFRLVVGTDYRPCERPVPAQWVPTPTPSDTSAGN
jgi:hypothetical protein